MKEGLPGGTLSVSPESELEEARFMLHAGLDLSRKRLGVCLIGDDGGVIGRLGAPEDADGLRRLVSASGRRVACAA